MMARYFIAQMININLDV